MQTIIFMIYSAIVLSRFNRVRKSLLIQGCQNSLIISGWVSISLILAAYLLPLIFRPTSYLLLHPIPGTVILSIPAVITGATIKGICERSAGKNKHATVKSAKEITTLGVASIIISGLFSIFFHLSNLLTDA
ncbi:MAG: hypothetical protein AAF492_25900 [Verrucomicrobiota bacterium]